MQSYASSATLRITPSTYEDGLFRLFTLQCPHGETEAWATNPDDSMVLAYACAYHTSREGCGCAEELFESVCGKKKVSTDANTRQHSDSIARLSNRPF
jgi:hypothetical protein